MEPTMKSDTELRIQIRDEITAQMGSRADDLDVQVLRGAVTLTGKLQSDSEKWSLCDAINGMPSVTRLTDDTMVVPGTSGRLPDADAARPWFPAG
jgi:osmotically-inducible protein OsmY